MIGKIYVVIGTRAQLIKMAPIMVLMQKRGIEYEFIYTAQHKEAISQILGDFEVKQPDRTIYMKSEANTLSRFFGWGSAMMLKAAVPKKIFPQRGLVLTHGDTVTTAWAAIVAKLAGCRVAHVESGMRSFRLFKPFPEELMRLVTFRFSDIYFCPNQWAVDNLKKYGGLKINLGLNPVYDSLKVALGSKVYAETPGEKYVVVSLHRFENIFTSKLESVIIPLLEKIANSGFLLLFVLHPSTRNVLRKNSMRLQKRLEQNNQIMLTDRYPYFQFVKLLESAEFVITDGGSNQEELFYLGKPTLLFREVTERIEGLDENAVLSRFDANIVMDFVKNYKRRQREFKVAKASPSQIVIDYLASLNDASSLN